MGEQMSKKEFLIRWMVYALVILAVTVASRNVYPQDMVSALATWDEPEYGTPAVGYILQLSTDMGPWYNVSTSEDTRTRIEVTYLGSHRVRVSGFDADGHHGPFSLPSGAYCPVDSFPFIGPPTRPMKIRL